MISRRSHLTNAAVGALAAAAVAVCELPDLAGDGNGNTSGSLELKRDRRRERRRDPRQRST